MIAPQDIDCAASAPNAIRSVVGEYANPGIFRTNATKLNAIGISEYFDLIEFTLKPLGPIKAEYIYTDIAAWTIDQDNRPLNVQELGLGWYVDEDGFTESWELAPGEYFEGWGDKVNWVEIGTYNELGLPVMFSLDNVVVGLHEL